MTTQNLKRILISCLTKEGVRPSSVSEEIVEHIISREATDEIRVRDVAAYQIGNTTIFLSAAGFSHPQQFVFVDVKSGESFLQELEH